jgi:hypothetical protein
MVNAYPSSRSACTSYLLLHHRRTPDTPARLAAINPSSFDRAVFTRLGRFREDLRTGEDTEFHDRLPPDVAVRWAPDVKVAHRYPTGVAALLREQFSRGRRRTSAERSLTGSDRRARLAVDALRNVRGCLRQLRRTSDPVERRQLTRAVPLLVPGALAYAAGVLLGAERED